MNVTLLGKGVFADVIKLKFSRLDHLGSSVWALNLVTE